MKKIRTAILILALLANAGCSAQTDPEEQAGEEKQTIVVWTWDDTFNVKAAKLAAEQYMSAHSDVNVIVETKEREEILSNTKMMLSAKVYENLPDVIMIEDYDIQDVLKSYQDEFVELTELVDYENYVDFKKQLCEKDGSYYGIPFDCGTAALFYRADILAEAGYSEADMQGLTWSEYIAIGEDVYEKTGIPMLTLDPTDLPLIRIMMQSCGEWYVEQDGVTANIMGNQALVQSLDIYKSLLTKNIGVSVNGWNAFISAFQDGEVASVISGGWIISSIKVNEEQSGLWRVAAIPLMEDNGNAVAASNVGGSAWYVLKNSENSELATDFMVEMFAENYELLDQLVEEIGIVPSLKDSTVLPSYSLEDPFFGGQQVTKLLSEFAAQIPAVNYGSKTYEIEDILETEIQNVLTEDGWEECLEHVQQKAEVVTRE